MFCSATDGIHVLSPAGKSLGLIRVPEKVSNCEFGGGDGRDLFVTASSSLYRIRTLTRGASARRVGPPFPDTLMPAAGSEPL